MSDPGDERFRPDFLDAAREGLEPTAADRARLRRSIAAQIVGIAAVTATTAGASAGTAAGGAAATAGAAAGSSVVAKVVLGAIAVSLAVGLGAMVARDRGPAGPLTVTAAEGGTSLAAPVPVVSAAPIAPRVEVTEPSPPPPPVAPAAHPAASRAASEGELTVETRLLARATEALRGGDPRAALALLDEHRRRFPRGILTEERDASRVFALCAMGSEQEALRSARQFAREHPRSGLGPKVARACGGP